MTNPTFNKARVNSFIDAVFAIAMTVLILDIPVPTSQVEEHGFWVAIQNNMAHIIGYIVSFFVIALYWHSHLKSSKYLTTYNNKLVWTYIFLLFFIVLLPYSTALYCYHFTVPSAFIWYCINLVIIGVISTYILVIIKEKEGFKNGLTPSLYTWHHWKSMAVVFIWLLAAILAYYTIFSRYIIVFLIPLNVIINKVFKNRIVSEQLALKKRQQRNKRKNYRKKRTQQSKNTDEKSKLAEKHKSKPNSSNA